MYEADCGDELAPIPSRYFALRANGLAVILLRGFKTSPPTVTSK